MAHPNEKFKKGEANATYTCPELVAKQAFRDFDFPMKLHYLIGKLIDRRNPINKIVIRNHPRILLTEQQREVIRERLKAYMYLHKMDLVVE